MKNLQNSIKRRIDRSNRNNMVVVRQNDINKTRKIISSLIVSIVLLTFLFIGLTVHISNMSRKLYNKENKIDILNRKIVTLENELDHSKKISEKKDNEIEILNSKIDKKLEFEDLSKILGAMAQTESSFKKDVVSLTKDCGILQKRCDLLNYFENKFWDLDVEYDWKKEEHGFYLALKILEHNYKYFKYRESSNVPLLDSISAYHLGIRGSKMKQKIPKKIAYLNKVSKYSNSKYEFNASY